MVSRLCTRYQDFDRGLLLQLRQVRIRLLKPLLAGFLGLAAVSSLPAGDGPWIASKQQGAATSLQSGVPQAFSLPAVDTPTLYQAPPGAFSIEVPDGVRSISISVQADHETYLDADIDVFVSVDAQPTPRGGGGVNSDYRARSAIASEMLTIDASSDPGPRGGTYFISLAQTIAGQPAAGSISVLVRLDDLPPAANLPAPSGMNVITTIAGASELFDGDGDPALEAKLSNGLSDVEVSPAGEVHFVDSLNAMVMKVRDDGILEVVAGNGSGVVGGIGGDALRAGIAPTGITFSPIGELFIAGLNGDIYRIQNGKLVVYADVGNGNEAASGRKLAFDRVGNLYVSEEALNRVLMVTPDGQSTVVVGTGDNGFGGDGGPAVDAQLSAPVDVIVDSSNNILIADGGNHRVRMVSGGMISTIAGSGGTEPTGGDGPALQTSIPGPRSLAIGPNGRLHIGEGSGDRIRRLTAGGMTETISGTGFFTGSLDGPGGDPRDDLGDRGPAPMASFQKVFGLAFNPAGELIAADLDNRRIRKIDGGGMIDTIAGSGQLSFSGDGGPARTAMLDNPNGLEIDPAGNLLIADSNNYRIRRIDAITGTINTIIGNGSPGNSVGDGGPASEASVNPRDMVFDRYGNLYIASEMAVRKVNTEGIIATIAGLRGPPPIVALKGQPRPQGFYAASVAVGALGIVYVADLFHHQIRAIGPSGIPRTIAGDGVPGFSGDGGPAIRARLHGPSRVVVAPDGSVFFADRENDRIRRIGPTMISTIGDGGPRAGVSQIIPPGTLDLRKPDGMVFDGSTALYITDTGRSLVRRLSATGDFTVVAGIGPRLRPGGDGGPATGASLGRPTDVAIDSLGNLYISDVIGNRVRKVLAAPPEFFELKTAGFIFNGSASGQPTAKRVILAQTSVPGMALRTDVRTADGGDWLQLRPKRGRTPRLVDFRADPAGLAPGEYTAEVDLIVPLANPPVRTFRVIFNVGAQQPPDPEVGAGNLKFTYVAGSRARAKSLRLGNRGGGVVQFGAVATTSDGAPWLSVNRSGGALSPSEPVVLRVRADPAGLPPGAYAGRIAISAASLPLKRVPVTMTIANSRASMLIPQTGLSYSAVAGGGVIPSQKFGVINVGLGAMPWTTKTSTLSGGDWLKVSPPSGVSTTGEAAPQVSVTIDQSGLEPGEYYGKVEIIAPDAANSPQQVPVFLEVLESTQDPGARIDPNHLIFSGVEGGSPSSQDIFVYNVAAEAKTFRASLSTDSDEVWFTALPINGTLDPSQPTRVLVQAISEDLPAGVHTGQLALEFSDGRVESVDITLVQSPAADAQLSKGSGQVLQGACEATTLIPVATSLGSGFDVTAGWPVGMQVNVVDDCGVPLDTGDVVVEFSNGDPELSLVSLQEGRWDGTWITGDTLATDVTVQIRAEDAASGVTGVAAVVGNVGEPVERPFFPSEGIVSAADFDLDEPGLPSPGSLVSIFGVRLSEGIAAATQFPLPEELAGTSLFIAGVPAPILFSSQGQINALIPYELEPNTAHRVIIQRGTTLTEGVDVNFASSQPAVFRTNPAGRQAHVYRPIDGALVLADAVNPAAGGDVVIIYATGLGAVDPQAVTGEPAGSAPLHVLVETAGVTLEGQQMPVLFSGLAPGFAGLYQINAFVPEGLPASDTASMIVEAGVKQSPAVTMAIE